MATLLAVLGRGTQMVEDGGWDTTEDIELMDGFKHFAERRPADDNDENCMIGGGLMNIRAATVLWDYYNPDLTVFAYGNRSPYLKENGYPSESRVMTDIFLKKMEGMNFVVSADQVDVFDEEEWKVEGSGTFQEIHNIFTLALKKKFDTVMFATILVHMPRALGMVKKQRDLNSNFKHIKFMPMVSEFVLTDIDHPEKDRLWDIVGSKAMIRNLQREVNGLWALKKDITQTTQLSAKV